MLSEVLKRRLQLWRLEEVRRRAGAAPRVAEDDDLEENLLAGRHVELAEPETQTERREGRLGR